jgi:cytochrome bd-type quinol oxidase subunit 1
VLPTFLAVSSISAGNVLFTLVGFIVFYSSLAIIDVYLMVKTIRMGPDAILSGYFQKVSPARSRKLAPAE